MKIDNQDLIILSLDNHQIGFPISFIDRIIRAVTITPLPKGPAVILGVIDLHGTIVPVLNLRKRFGLPTRDIILSNRFIIINHAGRKMALVVDEVRDVISSKEARITEPGIISEDYESKGIAQSKTGLVVIVDPEKFLSSNEEVRLDKALKKPAKK